MSFLSLTDRDREQMLGAIGVSSVEELFAEIPQGVRFQRELDLEPALSEPELVAHLEDLAARNVHTGEEVSFLGAGIYDHYVPAVVDAVLARGEFLTAYTPYQPEMSQGVLQAIFEYQTAICELTGMDVSNASGYDGTTVAADACYVAKHATGRSKVVLAETLNPQVRQVVKTCAPGFGLDVVEVPHRDGTIDPDELQRAARDAACVIFQQPNFFGCLEPAPDLAAAAGDAGALAVAHVDPVSLGVLEAPGAYGCALSHDAKERLREAGLELVFPEKATFKEFAVRAGRPARDVIRSARSQGVHPGYALGRDYAGLDDALLVAVTERRTTEEIDRLAEVLTA